MLRLILQHLQDCRRWGRCFLIATALFIQAPLGGKPASLAAAYLAAIVDWYSRRVLAWRLSNTLTADFCIKALQEAITRCGTPEIFNTDQGSQFTSSEFTRQLKANGIRISMDGKGCWHDNVFVKRLWRTIKYDEVYLKACESVSHAKASLGQFIAFYNSRAPSSICRQDAGHDLLCRPTAEKHRSMKSALPTALAAYGLNGPSATVTVDNATPQGSTYLRKNSVQTNGTSSLPDGYTSR